MTAVHGWCDPRFSRAREVFTGNFTDNVEAAFPMKFLNRDNRRWG